ncbi:MAG TPA: endonuclease/exonuclease/phosphatase family protein, partial [Polyangiaceae bacterium]|nr:endonuclease/exonuclease/phosphatase family protein [Polyangiaceae bacterium]
MQSTQSTQSTQSAQSTQAAPAGQAAPPADPAARGPFRMATFNAGLAVGYLPLAEERTPHVIEALARAPADLLCVQEVWLEAHWEALRVASAARFPHAFRLPPAGGGAPAACSADEVKPLAACAREHCAGRAPAGGLGQCVLQHCGANALTLSAPCLNCLLSNPVGDAASITAACLDPAAAPGAPARPPRGAPARRGAEVVAYGGSFGTGLLSRAPLLERDSIVFDASLNPRAALYARLRPGALGADLHVVCTHLSPALGAPLGGRPGSVEQGEQVGRLLAWVEQKTRGAPVVIVGDLNTGHRAGANVEALLPEHYAKFLAAGFVDPYASRRDARCTFCASNPLNGGAGTRGTLIDHVLLRGLPGGAAGEPFLREPLELEVGGRPLRTAYSDHYGLIV